MAADIQFWACNMCQSFGKCIAYKVPCANEDCKEHTASWVKENGVLRKLEINASKYCSPSCGHLVARKKVLDKIKDLPKKRPSEDQLQEFNQTIYVYSSEGQDGNDSSNFLEKDLKAQNEADDPFDYTDFVDDTPSTLNADKERAQSRIRDLESRLTKIDDILERTHKYNVSRGLSGSQAVCGYDPRIVLEWTRPGLSLLKDETASETKPQLDPSNPIELLDTQCQVMGRCQRHHGWQKMKVLEAEIELDILVIKSLLYMHG
jgi:hypothetical protein